MNGLLMSPGSICGDGTTKSANRNEFGGPLTVADMSCVGAEEGLAKWCDMAVVAAGGVAAICPRMAC